jgi:hypothetical protein
MNGDDLERRIGRLRTDAKALSRLALLWRQKPEAPAATVTGEECAKNARNPLHRLEALRRRGEAGGATGEECARTARDPLRRFEPLRRRGEETPIHYAMGRHG